MRNSKYYVHHLGPLTWKDDQNKHYLVGITSFVPSQGPTKVFGLQKESCGSPKLPDVFERVAPYGPDGELSWLEEQGLAGSSFINKCPGMIVTSFFTSKLREVSRNQPQCA